MVLYCSDVDGQDSKQKYIFVALTSSRMVNTISETVQFVAVWAYNKFGKGGMITHTLS